MIPNPRPPTAAEIDARAARVEDAARRIHRNVRVHALIAILNALMLIILLTLAGWWR